MDSRYMMWGFATVALVAVLVVVAWWFLRRRRRSDELRSKFGPEYDRTVRHVGDVGRAEATLTARAQRVERLPIHPLTPEDHKTFREGWQRLQEQFVDDPNSAITAADRLVGEVMHARGYPVGDFEQRVEDVSVDHPTVVSNYRAARVIAQAHERGQASTEELRQAMIHYRALFQDLLERSPSAAGAAAATTVRVAGRGRR